jgi:hypothetical protein
MYAAITLAYMHDVMDKWQTFCEHCVNWINYMIATNAILMAVRCYSGILLAGPLG